MLVASQKTSQEVNAEKTKYTAKSPQHNAGRNHTKRTDKSPYERVKQFEYSESTIANQNPIQGELKTD